jgi:hypothetical protein
MAMAAVWPENFGPYQRVSDQRLSVSGALWSELGFRDGESAVYESGGKRMTASAWRLADSTAALAAFDWQRPADAKPSRVAGVAAETGDGLLIAEGNYLLRFDGGRPAAREIAGVLNALPQLERAPLPTLTGYLPTQNLVPNSERYIVGPAGLAQFAPGIPPSAAAFHLGAEAEAASYRAPGGELKMTILEYPTHQLAMQQAEALQKLPGAMVKRSGPLVAVVLSPANADGAERLLSEVRYQAAVTMNERVPTRRDNIGNLVITAFEMTGFLLVFAAVSGIAYGGFRTLFRRGPAGQEADPMIVLHLHDR